jgi:hypothetical protein
MKQLSLFTSFCLLFTITVSAQLEAGGGYTMSVPLGEMRHNIAPVHSFQLQGAYALPSTRGKLAFGLETGIGTYAQFNKEQTFQFPGGNITRTRVNYTSNVLSGALTVRYNLTRKGKLTPFVALKPGYQHFYSNIYVEDPRDPDGCRALEQENILKDGAAVMGYGGGLRYNLGKGPNNRGTHWIEFSADYLQGGRIDYINTRQLKDGHQHNAQGAGDGTAKPLLVRFVNVSTQNIHDHSVAEVYNSRINLLNLRLSWVCTLGR